jgi:hypothetical protein
MKTFQRALQLIVASSVLCYSGSALAVTRYFEAYCQAPDGSRFMLRAQYNYSFLALGHTSQVSMIRDWEVYYSPRGRFGGKTQAPAVIRWADSTEADCSQVGTLDGVPVVNQSFLQSNGSWYPVKSVPYHQYLSSSPREQPEPVRQQLQQRGLFVSGDFTLLAPVKGRLLLEQPLLSHGAGANGLNPVSAVYQSASSDNGKSWSPPTVTDHAQLFEIGKPLEAQRYAARLVRESKK